MARFLLARGKSVNWSAVPLEQARALMLLDDVLNEMGSQMAAEASLMALIRSCSRSWLQLLRNRPSPVSADVTGHTVPTRMELL